ncbi:hypothetical protein A3K64_02210 [Candidatus Micrarchaeota archaeon RBG_16_36_9]|nr:MAG: hypothetical protein A3K64_02210 [Candidatus Micrarchaeota archaeon RBG_16_36_9]
MCNEYKVPIYSALAGILLTMITGVFSNIFLLEVNYWGYLFPWVRRMVYPGAPMEVLWVNFILDAIIWSVFIYLAILSVEKEKKRPARRSPARKRRR